MFDKLENYMQILYVSLTTVSYHLEMLPSRGGANIVNEPSSRQTSFAMFALYIRQLFLPSCTATPAPKGIHKTSGMNFPNIVSAVRGAEFNRHSGLAKPKALYLSPFSTNWPLTTVVGMHLTRIVKGYLLLLPAFLGTTAVASSTILLS